MAASLQLLFISPYTAFWPAVSGMLFGMVYWADWLEVRRRLKVCAPVLPLRLQSWNEFRATIMTQVPNTHLSCCTRAMHRHGLSIPFCCESIGAWLDRLTCAANGGPPGGGRAEAQNDGAAAGAPANVCCAPGHRLVSESLLAMLLHFHNGFTPSLTPQVEARHLISADFAGGECP